MRTFFKRYSIFQLFKLVIDVFRTKFTFNKAKILRFPIDIRGKRFICVKKGFVTGRYCRLEAYPENDEKVLFFGENVQINDFVHITAMKSVVIGNNVLIASKVYISDCSHGSYLGDANDSSPKSNPSDRKLFSKVVNIEDNVWLGELVSVLPGITIGKGTIVGANSVVSRSLPPYVIAVGVPAKPIKKFNFNTNKWEIIKN
ncbi:acetyltransferase [Flavobacterium tructae]|uniref:acetyltransferase n=1 Tax=Flavobacterium tructae TaxID=1114873 RepID=UPI0035A8CAA0